MQLHTEPQLQGKVIHCNKVKFKLTIKQLEGDRAVHVLPPVLAISGNWDLPVGPLARQVDAHTGNHCGFVLEAEGSEV